MSVLLPQLPRPLLSVYSRKNNAVGFDDEVGGGGGNGSRKRARNGAIAPRSREQQQESPAVPSGSRRSASKPSPPDSSRYIMDSRALTCRWAHNVYLVPAMDCCVFHPHPHPPSICGKSMKMCMYLTARVIMSGCTLKLRFVTLPPPSTAAALGFALLAWSCKRTLAGDSPA